MELYHIKKTANEEREIHEMFNDIDTYQLKDNIKLQLSIISKPENEEKIYDYIREKLNIVYLEDLIKAFCVNRITVQVNNLPEFFLDSDYNRSLSDNYREYKKKKEERPSVVINVTNHNDYYKYNTQNKQ